MNKHQLFGCLSALTLTASPLLGETNAPGAATAATASVVARVNGADITRAELDEILREINDGLAARGQTLPEEKRKGLESQALDQLIGQHLMMEKAKALKMENLDAKVTEQFTKLKQRVGNEQTYAAQLKAMNMTEEKLKQKIAEGIRMEAVIDQEVKNKIEIGPNEAKEFYDSRSDLFQRPAQVRASHILVRVPEQADEKVKAEKKTAIDSARARVAKGEDFGKVASEVSEDPGSKVNGGDLGFFGQGKMVAEFDKTVFALKSNEVSQIVTTQFGYHVIKQTDSRPATTVSLEEERAKIEDYLKQQKLRQGMLAYVEGLRKAAKVEVLLK